MPMTKDKKVQWHPAFYGAMHLELRENKQDLDFMEELILNTLPLRVDMLVIKKKYPCEIKNEIGRIFRKYNLIEYKSPKDTLNYDVFLKGIAYAYLYKSNGLHINKIPLDEVTLTFVRERKPIKLLKKLQREKFHIEQKCNGIYYIIKEGDIKIQIIVSKELSRENHIWLNSLSDKVDVQQAIQFIERAEQLEHLDDKNYADSLWEVVETVNKEIVQKVREDESMACKALTSIMQPKIDEAFDDGFNNGSLDKGISIFKNMIKDGMPKELAQKYAEISDELAEKALAEI
ncbi:MAG: hypothetical protein IKL06_01660 [Lachnospiraceae bacterium]|nr:hypothetical protein [Lachnospiraceae bacterium]